MTRHRADRADLIVETIADFRMTYGYGPTVLQKEGRITQEPGRARTLATTGTVFEDDSADALVKAVHNDPGVSELSADLQDRLARFYRRRWLA